MLQIYSDDPYKPRRFPKGAAVSDYRSGWLDNVTPQGFSDMVAVVLTRAMQGDLRACEMLLDRILPAVNVNLDMDGGDLRFVGESPDQVNEWMLKLLQDGIDRQREMRQRLKAAKPAIIDAKSVVISATDTREQVSAELTEEAKVPYFVGFPPEE
jgi:hypothetical protein